MHALRQSLTTGHNRYLPLALFAVAWLRVKFSFGNIFKAARRRITHLAQSAKRHVFSMAERPAETHEMKRALMT
jgi:hypothetical protein